VKYLVASARFGQMSLRRELAAAGPEAWTKTVVCSMTGSIPISATNKEG
jgi:hypothetical protein